MKQYHIWTKDEVRKIAQIWETKSIGEIAEELGVRPEQVSYMVGEMRKNGFNLSKKYRRNEIQSMLKEVLAEMV